MDDQVQQHELLNPYPAPVALLCDDVISERAYEELVSQVDAALNEPAAMKGDHTPAEEGRHVAKVSAVD